LWKNPAPFLLSGLIYAVILSAIVVLFYFLIIVGAVNSGDNAGGIMLMVGTGAVSAIALLGSYLIQAAYSRGALAATRGEPVSMGTFFQFANIGPVLVAALLVGLVVGVGTILCYIPGLIAAFLLQFTILFVIHRGMGAVDAMKASSELAKNNVGPAIILLLVVAVVNGIGSAICGIGMIVSMPLGYLITAHFYRRLIGEQPVPAPA
jgi:uncharacterized membrane protein